MAGKDGRTYLRVSKQTAELISGEDSLDKWDDEELLRGYKRDKGGKFRGRPPKIVPRDVHNELLKRRLAFAQHHLAHNLEVAVKTLTTIIQDPDAEDTDKLRAINMVVERVMGKEPIKVEHSQDSPWLVALQGAMVVGSVDLPEIVIDDDE